MSFDDKNFVLSPCAPFAIITPLAALAIAFASFDVTLRDCKVSWGPNVAESFSYAVEAKDTTGLKVEGLNGGPANKLLGKAVSIS